MADKKLNEVTANATVDYLIGTLNDGSTVRISKADLAAVVGGLLPSLKTVSLKSFKADKDNWYRIAESTVGPNYPSSLVVNISNVYGNENQKKILMYIAGDGYAENLATVLAKSADNAILKVRIVKKASTESSYKTYIDIMPATNNIYYVSCANIINMKMPDSIENVTTNGVPSGYTSVEFSIQ